jgi:hypothetical protein
MEPKVHLIESGLTIKELLNILQSWPLENEDGYPTEVWVGSADGFSSIVREVWPLNKRRDGSADLLLTWRI